jgi:hypothetical protein
MRISAFAAFTMAAVFMTTAPQARAAEDHGHDHHGHSHHAPHNGTLVALGDEAAHLELVLDAAAGELTGYVLDGEAEKSIRIKQPQIALQLSGGDLKSSASVVLKAVENPLTGEKAGDTSEFAAKSASLKNLKRFKVEIKDITVKGVNFKNVESAFPEGNH